MKKLDVIGILCFHWSWEAALSPTVPGGGKWGLIGSEPGKQFFSGVEFQRIWRMGSPRKRFKTRVGWHTILFSTLSAITHFTRTVSLYPQLLIHASIVFVRCWVFFIVFINSVKTLFLLNFYVSKYFIDECHVII